jgi:large subunit ribosomal protein L7/L12
LNIGCRPLHWAIAYGFTGIVELLIAAAERLFEEAIKVVRCSKCGEILGFWQSISYLLGWLFETKLEEKSYCYSCRAEKRADEKARELERNRQEIERHKALEQERQKRHEERRQALTLALKDKLKNGQDVYCYDTIYIPVDSVIEGTQSVNEFDISTLKLMGLDGWSIEGVVPKTLGVPLSNASIGSTVGETYGGGMGGNVVGVYILLKKRVAQIGEELSIDSLSIDQLLKALGREFNSALSIYAASAAILKETEQKMSFRETVDVILVCAGDRKIPVLKVVREETNLGLKEAKELIDSAPMLVKEGITKEEADRLKTKLEEAGAIVEIK